MSGEAAELAALIRDAGSVVALTGAGISVPSGIPDFRSPQTGLWANVDPRFDRIVRALDATGMRGLTRTEVSKLFSRNLPKNKLDELLAEVTSDGRYLESREPTAGRPVVRYIRTKEAK